MKRKIVQIAVRENSMWAVCNDGTLLYLYTEEGIGLNAKWEIVDIEVPQPDNQEESDDHTKNT